jgi:hypothetical protein
MFRDATPYSPAEVHRKFRGTYRLQLQDRIVRQASSQEETGGKLARDYLLGLFFDSQDAPKYL